MTNDDQSIQLLVALNKLTSLGTVSWTVNEPPRRLVAGTDVVIPLYLEAIHQGVKYALYQVRIRRYDGDRDQFYWDESVILAVLDGEDRVLFEVSRQYSALIDLFSTARSKLVSLDRLLKTLGIDGTPGN